MTNHGDRPYLAPAHPDALDVAHRLVAALQLGMDRSDADAYDAMFAADILWGSPKGAVLQGFSTLNWIHQRLFAQAVAPPSDFSVAQAAMIAPEWWLPRSDARTRGWILRDGDVRAGRAGRTMVGDSRSEHPDR